MEINAFVTLGHAVEKYDGYMKAVAFRTTKMMKGYLDPEDIYQELFIILATIHQRYNNLPVIDFTKIFYFSINNFIANLVTTKKTRNKVKMQSMESKSYNPTSDKNIKMSDLIPQDVQTDETYKRGIMDILNNVSPEAGQAILDSFDPRKRGNSARGIKEAFDEVREYLSE